MSNLPPHWVAVPLSHLLSSLESGSRPRGGVRRISDGVPSIGGEHLKYDGTFDFSSIKYVPSVFAERMTRGHIKKNDILIVKDGATTGKTAFVDRNFPYENAVVNEHVFICRPVDHIEPKFLFRFLMSKEGQDRILENFKGSAQGGVNQSFAQNTVIPIAPINEQHRVILKLEMILAKIGSCQKRLEKIPAIIKRFRQSILSGACSGALTADWRKENPRPPLLDSARNWTGRGDPPEIPASWRWVPFGRLTIAFRSGSTEVPKNEPTEFPILRSSSVRNGSVDLSDVRYLTKQQSGVVDNYLRENDLLFTRLSGSLKYVANCGLVRGLGSRKIQYPDRLFCAKLADPEIAPYIEACFSSPVLREYISVASKSSAGHQRISMGAVTGQPIPFPPKEEQHEIIRRVVALFSLAGRLEARYSMAKGHVDQLSQPILSKAFRGELVPYNPNDGPALVILDPIRKTRV